MSMHKLAVRITLGLMLTAATSWAGDDSHGKQIPVNGSFAGSFSPLAFDENNDGQKASLDLTTATGNLGPFTTQCVSEYLPALTENVTCPSGTVEFPLIKSMCLSHNTITLDQLVSLYSSGASCVDMNSPTFTAKLQGNILTGTGRYAGATGPVQSETTGFFFDCDPTGGCFGSENGTVSGTLILP